VLLQLAVAVLGRLTMYVFAILEMVALVVV